MHFRRTLIALSIALTTAAAPSWAATYYVVPRDTVINYTPDCSKEKPCPKLYAAMTRAKPGDTILLMDGYYGGQKFADIDFDGPVTIRSMNAKKARFDWLEVRGKNLVVQNISVWANYSALASRTLVLSSASDVVFEGLDVRGGQDATTSSYPTWTSEEWNKRKVHGLVARGSRTIVKNSTFTGMNFGIQLLGANSQALNNTVQGFSGDGMRALGINNTVRGNRIVDCVQVDSNHADGFQAWRTSGEALVGLVLEQNVILEWANTKTSPVRCKLQGIALFDGFYDNFSITNNVVSVRAYHGIIVSGGRKGVIANNTIVNATGNPASYPWLNVAMRKGGVYPSVDVVVSNNLAMSFRNISQPENRVVSSANSVIQYPAQIFQDVLKLDYTLKSSSGFIDTGNSNGAPTVDVRNYRRPAGSGPDRGAYEMNSSTVTTTEATTSSTTSTAGKWLSAP
jgi:hypothetical protein